MAALALGIRTLTVVSSYTRCWAWPFLGEVNLDPSSGWASLSRAIFPVLPLSPDSHQLWFAPNPQDGAPRPNLSGFPSASPGPGGQVPEGGN